jgi:hypothetical protein
MHRMNNPAVLSFNSHTWRWNQEPYWLGLLEYRQIAVSQEKIIATTPLIKNMHLLLRILLTRLDLYIL